MINILPLPDLVGMLILMGVLAWARTKYRDQSVNLWLLGLTFIFTESVAVAFYKNSQFFHSGLHAIALGAYLLAAVTFGSASHQDILPGTLRLPILLLPSLPLLLITTAYGLEETSPTFYVVIVATSVLLGMAYILVGVPADIKYKSRLIAIHLTMWLPMLAMAHRGTLRWTVYYGLAYIYMLVAASFRDRVRRDGMGGIVIVCGFAIWALCLLLHPLVRNVEVYDPFFSQIWDMQKFFVIIGMLLVLLEDQTRQREQDALHDSLTGLPNRRLFDDRLSRAIDHSRRHNSVIAVFILDLNGFKQINDVYGHHEGDLALKLVAQELRATVHASDTLARCGGDEFTVISNDEAGSKNYDLIAERLRVAVSSVGAASGGRYSLSCSVGYALFPHDATEATKLCEIADLRMYEEKRLVDIEAPMSSMETV
ncbi:GGDEF domain-containing protein [Granulicella sp. dw_53]|uniref:GGDEF domain-containing protein n=1 Tax=Granulicella sp. dw_53 TaxID=2719792 RepID=UPI001BD33232|nr:GGDEF domain-containing protein [Granulicella sp. dw_53]